jgi:hypothetical protein
MLGAIDFPARPVQLPVDLPFFGFRQVSAVQLTVSADFLIDGGFIFFEPRRLTRTQLARSDAGCDPVLLIVEPLVHFIVRRGLGGGVVLVVVNPTRLNCSAVD